MLNVKHLARSRVENLVARILALTQQLDLEVLQNSKPWKESVQLQKYFSDFRELHLEVGETANHTSATPSMIFFINCS